MDIMQALIYSCGFEFQILLTNCHHFSLAIMVDVDSSRLYEVLPMDMPSSAPTAWSGNPKLKHSQSYTGSSNVMPPMSYNTYAVPRGVNGTPPTSRTIPPAVPPRNRNMSEGGEGHGSQGNSPNDKGGLFPMRSKSGVFFF